MSYLDEIKEAQVVIGDLKAKGSIPEYLTPSEALELTNKVVSDQRERKGGII